MSWVATSILGTSLVTSYLSADAQADASADASAAELEAAQLAIDEQARQFDAMQALLAPYVAGGETAFTAQQNLIGLGGDEAQKKAISALEGSEQFKALTRQGEEGILAAGSATGGLRGGDIQGVLAQYRPKVLSQMIEAQYSKLGGISGMGQASAAGVGAAGMQSADAISALLQSQGESQAQSLLTAGQSQADLWGDVGGSLGTYLGTF